MTERNPHPWYGPCDGFAPGFQCSECWDLRGVALWFWAQEPGFNWAIPASDFVPAQSQPWYWSLEDFNNRPVAGVDR